jgi:hypothetical protein
MDQPPVVSQMVPRIRPQNYQQVQEKVNPTWHHRRWQVPP